MLGILNADESSTACSMSPLPELPDSPTNAVADDDAAATLGQKFYFENDWAGPLTEDNALGTTGTEGLVSCRVCHDTATFASEDPRGVGTGLHPRHAPGSVNSALYSTAGYTWRGRFDVLWALPRAVFEAGPIFNSSRLRVAHVVFDKYQSEYDAVFSSTPLPNLDNGNFPDEGKPKADPSDPDGDWEGMQAADQEAINLIVANVGKALEAYQRRLVVSDSDFDRFIAGDDTAMSEAAQRGFGLFVGKAGCVDCHSGPLFSDQSYRNLGLEASDGDLGRFNVIGPIAADPFNGAGDYSDDTTAGQAFLDAVEAQTDDLQGKFRVPSLRDAARSAPYMHNGSFDTLAEVIDFYDAGGTSTPNSELAGTKDPLMVPLGLTEAEKDDLEAFIEALDGGAIPAALTMDTSN
jgi:cytochrome c peroxidase